MAWIVITDDHRPAVGGIATWTDAAVAALATVGPVRVWCRWRPGLPATTHGVRVRSFAQWGPFALASAVQPHLRDAAGVLCTSWPVARVVSRLAPVHVVAHGADVVRPSHAARLRRVWSRCARGWAVSEHLAEVVRSRGLEAAALPSPLTNRAPVEGGARWVMVARALHGKGGDRFVRWVAEAGAAADLVGDGPALLGWKRLAVDLGANVTFHGHLEPVRRDQVLERAALVALPSRRTLSEGLGLTLLEARGRGIPVVATVSGGSIEALGPRGLRVPSNNPVAAVRQIEDWLKTAVADPLRGPDDFLRALGAG